MTVDGWKAARLEDAVALRRGHDLPATNRVAGNVPVLGSFGVTGYHDSAIAQGPGVTIGRSGASFGVVSFSSEDYWPLNTALYVTDFRGNDERFVYFLLKTIDLRRFNSGSAQPSLNRNYLRAIPVLLPPLAEQRAIAGVLGALDDKIELNRRMNETLAELAEAMYEDLRRSAQRAALFGDVVELAYGKALKASGRRPGTVFVYGSNGIVGCHDEALSPGPGIVVGRKGNPGVVTWADEPFFPIDTAFYVVPRLSEVSLFHLYFALRKLDLPSFAADSAVPGLNRNIAYGLEIKLPETEALRRFDSVVSPLFGKRATNDRESRTLAELRDALLPKLISGELRVRDTEWNV